MNDSDDLLEVCVQLVDEYFRDAPLAHHNPTCDEGAAAAVAELLEVQLDHLNDLEWSEISETVDAAVCCYRASLAVPRQHPASPVLRRPDVARIRSLLAGIRAIPQPEQRTPEWYAFRGSYLTASSAWKAFGSPSARNQLIYDKCKAANTDASALPAAARGVNIESPLHWGQKYEPVTAMWYEHRYGTKIGEFGCIPHPKIECLAASPDGINVDPSNPRYGRMLEIKNVVSREITGIPKLEYWIQMQLQMAVCGLRECDFLETKFREYDDEAEWKADGEAWRTTDGNMKGRIIQFMVDGAPFYEYQPLSMESDEAISSWVQGVHDKHKNDTWIRDIYWKLEVVSCVLVEFNEDWMRAAECQLRDTWEVIRLERDTDFEHRAPQRRKAPMPLTEQMARPRSCLLTGDGRGGFAPVEGALPPLATGEMCEIRVVTSPLTNTSSSRSSSPCGLHSKQVALGEAGSSVVSRCT